MSFMEHLDAIRKDMQSMNVQFQQNKAEIEKTKHEMSQIQLQIQNVTDQTAAQLEIVKFQEISKKLESIARTYVSAINDMNVQVQMMGELDSLAKGNTPGMPVPMSQHAAMNAAALNPHMMMRNPMMGAMASPRVAKNGGMPNGAGMNGMQAMMHQMQLAQMQALMQAQMFNQMPMMMPGMAMPGMPPGMAGIPGMMPPSSAAAAAMQHFNAAQAQQMAAAISVSTPSRNQSASGMASRTRTPLTASATNSPRPSETMIKEEPTEPVEAEVPVSSQPPPVSEDSTTVAVA